MTRIGRLSAARCCCEKPRQAALVVDFTGREFWNAPQFNRGADSVPGPSPEYGDFDAVALGLPFQLGIEDQGGGGSDFGFIERGQVAPVVSTKAFSQVTIEFFNLQEHDENGFVQLPPIGSIDIRNIPDADFVPVTGTSREFYENWDTYFNILVPVVAPAGSFIIDVTSSLWRDFINSAETDWTLGLRISPRYVHGGDDGTDDSRFIFGAGLGFLETPLDMRIRLS